MKSILPLAVITTQLIGFTSLVHAGESVSDTLGVSTNNNTSDTSNFSGQNWFGPPYIQFGRKNSETLLPGYAVGTSSYTHRFSADFDKSGLGDVSSNEFTFWTPIAALNREEFHLVAWLGYTANKYNTSGSHNTNMLTESTLQSINMPIAFIHDISEEWLWGAMVMPTYAGTQSSSDNFAYSVAAGVGYTYNPNLQLFVGVYYFNGFGDDLLIPGAAFIWRPNDRWEAFFLPPFGGISYSVNDNFFVGLYGQYDAPEWHVNADKYGPDRDISMSGLRLGLQAEYHVGNIFWAYANTGFSFGRTLEVEDTHNNSLQESDIDVSPFIQIGINARF